MKMQYLMVNAIKGGLKMIKLENWREVTKGLYRYVISPGACYEIHIMHHSKNTDILTANASLYIVGDWHSSNGSEYFEIGSAQRPDRPIGQ